MPTSLLTNLAKESKQDDAIAALVQVRDAIKAQIDIASTVWTDNSGAFYVRRDLVNEGTGAITVTFTAPDGTAATPGAGLRPLSDADRDVTQALFDATAGGTGYSAGDVLARLLIIDAQASPAAITALWVNLTSGAAIAAPTGGTFVRADENITVTGPLTDAQLRANPVPVSGSFLVVGGATEATLAGAAASLVNIDTDLGAKADTPATDDAGTWSIIALFKRISAGVTSLVSRIPYIGAEAPLPVYIAGNPDGLTPNVGVSGKAPNGTSQPFAVDANGGTFPADAPEVIRVPFAGPTGAIIAQGSTRGFNSIQVSYSSGISGALIIWGTLDGVTWTPISCVSSGGFVFSQANVAGHIWSAPCFGVSWRVTSISFTSGSGVVSIALRSQTVPFPAATNASNILQIAGVNVATGGLGGSLAFGGTGAANAATLQNPMLMGGYDGALLRRILTDQAGAQVVRGALQNGNAASPLTIRDAPSDGSTLNVNDALLEVIAELRVHSFLLSQLPLALASGTPRSEDVDDMRASLYPINVQ